MNVCTVLDLDINKLNEYTKDDIKQIYKKIALECHPDKLNNIQNIDEKADKIEKFKQASIAYKLVLEDLDKYGKILRFCGGDGTAENEDEWFFDGNVYDFSNLKEDFEIYKDLDRRFWESTLDILKDKDFLKNTFNDVASFFLKHNFHTKKYYNPNNTEIIKHNIYLPVTYRDLHKKSKKKLRLLLKGVSDPVFLNINCKKDYPCVTRQYIDDSGQEHEIIIKMNLDNSISDICQDYSHIINDDGTIDLVKNINVTWIEYLEGCKKQIEYIDAGHLDITIYPFDLNNIVMKGKGIFGGKLIIYLNIINIQEKEWKNLDERHKKKMIEILKMI